MSVNFLLLDTYITKNFTLINCNCQYNFFSFVQQKNLIQNNWKRVESGFEILVSEERRSLVTRQSQASRGFPVNRMGTAQDFVPYKRCKRYQRSYADGVEVVVGTFTSKVFFGYA